MRRNRDRTILQSRRAHVLGTLYCFYYRFLLLLLSDRSAPPKDALEHRGFQHGTSCGFIGFGEKQAGIF